MLRRLLRWLFTREGPGTGGKRRPVQVVVRVEDVIELNYRAGRLVTGW